MIKTLSSDDFDKEVLESERPVLVDFYASWCGPCSMQTPLLDGLAERLGGQAKIVKIDIDREPELALQFDVRSVPTLLVFRNGRAHHRFIGLTDPGRLHAALLAA